LIFTLTIKRPMKFNKSIHVEGDLTFRGECPTEAAEQITFFSAIKLTHPKLAKIAVHIRNEGQRNHQQTSRYKSEGMNVGASDIIIPCNPTIVIELKRRDHTKCRLSTDQEQYLIDCQAMGSKTCIALGWEAAINFINKYCIY